jgi:hypothetical protein
MKSAYELAMERLSKASPTLKLTAKQKAEISDLEARYAAKIAERDLLLKPEMAKSQAEGNFEEFEKIEKQLQRDRSRLKEELEAKKEAVRGRSN